MTVLIAVLWLVAPVATAQQLMKDPTVEPRKPVVLKGNVQTLEAAMEAEAQTVDWYSWYLAARSYLRRTGGLQCPLGTRIYFHKNGTMETDSSVAVCRLSVARKRFPLPEETSLEILILPVRSPNHGPASRKEILKRTRGGQ